MIKFKIEGAEKPLIGFGITEENVKRLKLGRPILINLQEMGINVDILICYGETELELVETLKPYISDRTVIRKPDNNHDDRT